MSHQFLPARALHMFCQLPLKQSEGLQRLAQVMAGGSQKARFCDIGQSGLMLRGLQRVRGVFAFGDINKGYDHAFHFVGAGAVGQNAPDIADAVLRFDLALDRDQAFA